MRSLPIPFVAPVLMGTSAWLLRLRWLAVFGQLAAVFTAGGFLGDQLPWWPLLSLIALTAITNVMYWYWLDRIDKGDRLRQEMPSDGESRDATPVEGQAFDAKLSGDRAGTRKSQPLPRVDRQASQDRVATSLMIIDLITLTAMLGFSGGIDNPFSLFFSSTSPSVG